MSQENFLQLLQSIQIPDTEKVKAATAELRKNYYNKPESLLWLLQILVSHDAFQTRQQAAVEALRLVPKHWAALPNDQKPAIRERLLESTTKEQNTLVRHSAARVVSAIASIDLEDGEWSDLPATLAQACASNDVNHRDVAVYLLFTLLEATGDGFTEKFPNLFQIFSQTLKDPESAEVRVNTMLALSRMAMLIEPEEDPKNLQAFQQIFPGMVEVLKNTIDSGDEDRTMQAFEVFQTLLGCESALIANHFKDLIQFMLEIAANTQIDESARSQAISFLMQCVKYRRMKVQAMPDMGKQLTLKSMEIATEIEEAEDDDDDFDITPARSALGLLDQLASSLPPRQVIVPLLDVLPNYVNHSTPSFRKAGILALGMCVEGAPDFIATQLSSILPTVMGLLNDPVSGVRSAALHSFARLADDLAEDMAREHASLIPALLKNLDAASTQSNDEAEQKVNIELLKASCAALEALAEGFDKETVSKYLPELVPRVGRIFGHPDYKVKASAAGALGSIAGAAEEAFMNYFEPCMKSLSQFVEIKDGEDELDLRATVCDAMGSIATAVGPDAFKSYVPGLMQASEEALHLGHPRLRETSYILWSTMAKVYESEFTPFLEGAVKGLLDCLAQEENDFEVELGEEASELAGQEVIVAGKKIKVTTGSDDIEDIDVMDDEDEDDDDWEALNAVTAIAQEKEIAVEVIGDVLSHTRDSYIPYLEKTVESVMGLIEHSYEGVRKGAISTLWRAYACLWALMEDHTKTKWTPGIPLKQQPTTELVKLGEVVATATMSIWADEVDRGVVTDINRNIAATLKLCGPAILTHENMVEQVTTVLAAIITKGHPCQQDLGDEEDFEGLDESSEYDWLVIDTALDVIIGLSTALGEQFGEMWKIFEKPILKYASSQDATERSTAVGVIAECIAGMGHGVTPYTDRLLKLLLHRLTDEDLEAKSNAAYATGQLVFNSTNAAAYTPSYNQILAKLEPLLHTGKARLMDNAAGCVCRMIMAHPDLVPLDDVLPVLAGLLPLKEDYEENKPIYECIVGLYQHGNQTIRSLTPKLAPVFQQVLSPPEEQLDQETRKKLTELVEYLKSQ